ncbi:RDD family protein [Lacisediminihabitans sp.]|uniref:RDD family protein n=1 Tax=Lacisediminihabitans sp. TaxID=2787631 RepID=UPI00374D6BFC
MRAPLGRRLLAVLIDYAIILGWVAILLGGTLAIDFVAFGGVVNLFDTIGIGGSEAVAFASLTLPVGIYLWATEAGGRHATVGKRAMGLRVLKADGSSPSAAAVLLRTIVKLLPWEFAHFVVFQVTYYALYLGRPDSAPPWVSAGLVAANLIPLVFVGCVALTPSRRGPHDFAAGTVVGWSPPRGGPQPTEPLGG